MPTRTVILPLHAHNREMIERLGLQFERHERKRVITLEVPWVCPKCGGPRGEPEFDVIYGDGYHHWGNPCRHTDYYIEVIKEAVAWRDRHPKADRYGQLSLFKEALS